jgi:hypothetical protein
VVEHLQIGGLVSLGEEVRVVGLGGLDLVDPNLVGLEEDLVDLGEGHHEVALEVNPLAVGIDLEALAWGHQEDRAWDQDHLVDPALEENCQGEEVRVGLEDVQIGLVGLEEDLVDLGLVGLGFEDLDPVGLVVLGVCQIVVLEGNFLVDMGLVDPVVLVGILPVVLEGNFLGLAVPEVLVEIVLVLHVL